MSSMDSAARPPDAWWAPVAEDGRVCWWLVLLLLLVNGLVASNAVRHPPTVGYDAEEHLRYVAALAELRLPRVEDTHEYFNPPLAYLVPAVARRLLDLDLEHAGRVGQLANVVVSVALTWLLLHACMRISRSVRLRGLVLLCLGMLPVYYKTMAFVRPEPYVALLTVLVLVLGADVFGGRHRRGWGGAVALGFALGAAVLARQWGLLVVPPVVVVGVIAVVREPECRRVHAARLAITLAIAVVLTGWFFTTLTVRYGSPFAFPRPPAGDQLELVTRARQLLGSGSPFLFSHPVRPAFPNQLAPIFYSETWGDYWCYFVVAGRMQSTGAWISGVPFRVMVEPADVPPGVSVNRFAMAPYLGRVNLVSLLPTAVLLLAAALALPVAWRSLRRGRPSPGDLVPTLAVLVAGMSLAGYLWFVLQYPSLGKGDTVKASYMLHVFPCAAILAGQLLERLRETRPRVSGPLVVALALVWLHNLAACLTHYTP